LRTRRRIKSWLIEAAIGMAIFLAMLLGRGVLEETEPQRILAGLCDAFFVPGILFISFGLLALCAYGGVFDMIAYGAKSLLVLFTPFKKPEKHQYYFEYKVIKEGRRQKPKPYMLIIGCCFMLMAGICLVAYYLLGA